jgi:hypothetical protein
VKEPEAMRRATPRLGGIFLTTVLIWVVTLSVTWIRTRGDYYRTFPSGWWFWAFALPICWTGAAWYTLSEHLDSQEVEEVPLSSLKLSSGQPVSIRAQALPPLEEIDSRRHTVLGEYGAFLSDICAIADAPLLADPTYPTTDRFREQLVIAEDAHSSAVRDPKRLEAYLQAVRELEKLWQKAQSHAKRKGGSTLDPAEQDTLRRARTLLDIALDDTAFAPERRAAMHKAIALLRTIIDIPEQASTAIEHRVKRLEIEG